MKIYNTLSKRKEEFVPLEEGKVKMYVCGVTPYNHPHIGNARPFVTWDVIRRYLEQQGWEVMHVQNFTDVDDKIIRTANEEQVPWHAISERYIASYFEVMDKLNVRRAAIYPKVSTHMQEIIDISMTETLSRTLITSGTTLFTVVALFVMGGALIHGFATALLIGIGFGTYSSIYVASAWAMYLKVKREHLLPTEVEKDESGVESL